jgi:ATP-dependent DNA ligase
MGIDFWLRNWARKCAFTQRAAPNGATGFRVWEKVFAALPADSVVVDGELCLCDSRGRPDFRALHAEMRQKRPDVSRMAFFAFDLLVRERRRYRHLRAGNR